MVFTHHLRIATTCLVLIICIVYLLPTGGWNGHDTFCQKPTYKPVEALALKEAESQTNTNLIGGELPLPAAYKSISKTQGSTQECAERYGALYIRKFSERVANHCQRDFAANLTCFSHKAHSTRTDSFCVGRPVTFDPDQQRFRMNCDIRKLDDDELANDIPQFSQFPAYWYQTGPRAMFANQVNIAGAAGSEARSISGGFLFLVRREDNNQNMWHRMMEVMSLELSLDVLRTNVDLATNGPYFTDNDMKQSRVVFLDRLPDDPFSDLWTISTGMPSMRLHDLEPSDVAGSSIVVPLPGGSNPFWQGDWVDIDCGESQLLHAYVRRVLDRFSIETIARKPADAVRVSLIDRRTKRKLLNQDKLFAAIQQKWSTADVEFDTVDYASLPFAEQLKVSAQTDVLVGVHGAGLTHGMFLPPQSTIVEILPPDLNHKGFHNMAKFLGHQYFGHHGTTYDSPENNGDWQHDDVLIEEDQFMDLISEAITHGLGNRRSAG